MSFKKFLTEQEEMTERERKDALLRLRQYFEDEHGFDILSTNYGPFLPINYVILSEVSKEMIEEGLNVEKEHTTNKFYQFLITMHHIMEDREYYKKLSSLHVD